MRRTLRISLWIFGGIATLLAVVILAAWFYTKTDHFRALLEKQALAAVEDTLAAEVTFERLTGSIWRRVELHNISIRQNDVEVISIPQLAVELSLLRQALSFIFSSSLHVAAIEIDGLLLNAVQDSSGQWNLASLLKRTDEPEKRRNVTIFIDGINVRQGRIEARLADGKAIQLTSIAAEANLALLTSGIKADVAALDFAVSAPGLPPVQWKSAFSSELVDSESVLDLRQLSLSTAESHLRLSGKVRDFAKPDVALHVALDKISAAELRTLLPAIPLQQNLSGALKMNGPASALRLAGNLNFADGQLLPAILADLSQTSPRLDGSLEAKNFVINKVLNVADVGGLMNGRISFNGTSFKNARASMRGFVSGFAVRQWQLGDLNLAADLREQRLALRTNLASKNGQAQMEGEVALAEPLSYEAKLQIRKLDVQNTAKTVSASAPITGEINLDAWFKGRGTDPAKLDGLGTITILPSRLGKVEELEGKLAGSLREGILTLDQARFASKGTTFNAQGKISAFAKTPSGKLTYAVRAQEIAPWTALAAVEGKGALNADGTAAGTLKNLILDGKANLSRVELPAISFGSGNASWNLSGVGSAQPAGKIRVATREVVAGIHLRALQADLSLAGIEPMNVRASVAAEDKEKRIHRLRGQARYSSDSTDFLVEQVALQSDIGMWHMAQPARLQLNDKRIAIDNFVLQSGTQSARLNGIFALQGTHELQAEVRRFPLEELRAFVATDPRLGGELSAEMALRGSSMRPLLQSQLKVERLSIAGQSYAGFSGEAFYKDERLTVDLILRQDASHFLTAKGGIPIYLGWGGEKSVAVLGEADLWIHSDGLNPAFLTLASDGVEKVQGNLIVDLRLRGTAQALRPTGIVELQQAQARVKELGLLVSGVDLQAKIAPGAVQITRVSARSGEGQLTGGGKVALKGYSVAGIDLALQADDFRVLNTAEYVAAVSGRVTATGSLEQPWVRGALTLTQAKLRPNVAALRQKGPPPRDSTILVVKDEQELAQKEQQATLPEPAPAQNGFVRRLGLDITAVVPRGTWVYVDDGSVELMGKLRIRKEPHEELALTGTIESVRGWYSFHGKRFRVEKAHLVFTGGSTIDPNLDIIARHNLPQYQIDLVVGGTAKKPTLALRSEPAMEQADILATILFGKPVGALNEGQQTALQAQALKTTANFVASDLRRSVAKRLGVDNLEFGFGESVSEARIGVGKYVSEDVYVSASQEFGAEKKQEYVIEYNMTPNWQFKGSTTPQGNSGIDLIWRKQY